MKAILISDHAKWCALMMSGKKNVEVRKGTALYKATQKLIDEYGFAEFYVYCTKGKPNLWLPYEYDCFELDEASQPYLSDKPIIDIDTKMNGKVIFKFRCYKVEEISWQIGVYELEQQWFSDFLDKCCLGFCELKNYLNKKNGCAIHISNLEIFDKPKELGEFSRYHEKKDEYSACWTCKRFGTGCMSCKLTKAPQSFMYVEVD